MRPPAGNRTPMIENTRKTAFFTKALFILLFAISALALLYVAREIVIPLVFSTILAILISPVVAFLVRRKMNRVVAITIVLCLSIALLAAFAAHPPSTEKKSLARVFVPGVGKVAKR